MIMRQLLIALVLGGLFSMVVPAAAQDWMPAATLELSQGTVAALKKLEDFSGTYVAGGAGWTLFGGGEAVIMKNQNGVVVEMTTSNGGVKFKLAASGIRLTLEQ